MKINVDAAFPSQSDVVWVGMVAHNNSGDCIWWNRKKFVGRLKSVDGEALAIHLHCSRERLDEVKIGSDCLAVINSLSSTSSLFCSFGAIVESCLAFSGVWGFKSH